MFNRNHYDFLAKSLKDSKPTGVMDQETWERTVRTIAHDLKGDNTHFSFPAFYKACGLDKKKK
jgi:hypothetical protein